MESNNNQVIMVTIDWHRVACNYIFFDENCYSVSGISMLRHLMLHKVLVLKKSLIYITGTTTTFINLLGLSVRWFVSSSGRRAEMGSDRCRLNGDEPLATSLSKPRYEP